MQTKVTPGQIVVMAAGGVALIASFFDFYDVEASFVVGDTVRTVNESVSAWGDGLFPIATLIVLYCVAAGLLVALTAFANLRLTNVAGFGLFEFLFALSVPALLLSLAFLIADTPDKGIGFWLLLLSSIASVVGTVLLMNERPSPGTGTA